MDKALKLNCDCCRKKSFLQIFWTIVFRCIFHNFNVKLRKDDDDDIIMKPKVSLEMLVASRRRPFEIFEFLVGNFS